jgi:hypothetical protein
MSSVALASIALTLERVPSFVDPITNISAYKFTPLDDLPALRERLLRRAAAERNDSREAPAKFCPRGYVPASSVVAT